MKKIVALAFSLLVICSLGCASKQPPQVGETAPDFKVSGLDGATVSLSSLRGNVVLVNFWATWCPPCREELPSLAKLNAMMAGKPFRLMAISIDEGGKEAVQGLFSQSGVSLPAYLDPDTRIAQRYGTFKVPETYIVDKQGKIVKKVIGGMDWSSPMVVDYLNQLMAR